jgi:hypothetical protein
LTQAEFGHILGLPQTQVSQHLDGGLAQSQLMGSDATAGRRELTNPVLDTEAHDPVKLTLVIGNKD